ncbi:MAG TPA: hypothetical protein VM689_19555 [Aliidongia sp.]|nr:hypothetical protein [Aliidongia sp.]
MTSPFHDSDKGLGAERAPPPLVRVFAPINGLHWLSHSRMPLRGAGIPDTIDPSGDFVYTG